MNTTKDHLGNEFKSVKDMCEYYNISTSTFHLRYKQSGWTLEDSLTKPPHHIAVPKKIKDHLGNEYESIGQMCKKYNISPAVFYMRQTNLKWSLEDSLTLPIKKIHKRKSHILC